MVRRDRRAAVPPGDAASLAVCLRRLTEEPGLLDTFAPGSCGRCPSKPKPRSCRDIYAAMISRAPRPARPVPLPFDAPPGSRGRGSQLPDGGSDVACVRSLQTSFSPPRRILVVDNGSCDGSVESLRASLRGRRRRRDRPQSWLFRRVQRGHLAALARARSTCCSSTATSSWRRTRLSCLLDASPHDSSWASPRRSCFRVRSPDGSRRPESATRGGPAGCASARRAARRGPRRRPAGS